MGAFGLNASILDAANIAWKLGLCAKGQAQMGQLLPTYDQERRLHAADIIEISGKYLRFVCSSQIPTARVHRLGADLGIGDTDLEVNGDENGKEDDDQECLQNTYKRTSFGSHDEAKAFLKGFFSEHGQFLLGVDAPYGRSCLSPPSASNGTAPAKIKNGVRAPNPRVCLSTHRTGYLYDVLKGASRFHLVVFASNLRGAVRSNVCKFSQIFTGKDSRCSYGRYAGPTLFNIVLVAKGTPFEIEDQLAKVPELRELRQSATVLADDRAPDEDAHSTWGVDHRQGAVVLIRPDLWVGVSFRPDDVGRLRDYLDGFLTHQSTPYSRAWNS